MRHFFDKRAMEVDVTDKEVNNLFQDSLYHHRTFEDFDRRRPSSVTKLKDMITSWADEEDMANAKYDSIRSKSKHNTGSNSNGNNNNNKTTTKTTKIKEFATKTTTWVLITSASQTTQSWLPSAQRKKLEEDLWRLQRLVEREVSVASRGQSHHRAVLPTPASTQRNSRPAASS
jgi:hypothetical protein